MVAGTSTQERIVEAALATVIEAGVAGASARAIAARGKFNQALIFYHFGTIDDLLLAALDRSNEGRLAAYGERFAAAATLPELVVAARELYAEDARSGHIRMLAEMVAAGAASPELGRQVAARVEPWLQLTRETFARMTVGSPLAMLLSADDVAHAMTSLLLGMELMSQLEGSHERADALFESASRLVSILAPLLQSPGGTA